MVDGDCKAPHSAIGRQAADIDLFRPIAPNSAMDPEMKLTTRCTSLLFLAAATVLARPQTVCGQDTDLAAYFGFRDLEVIKIGRGAGPVIISDINEDGLNDLVVVNNFASRIELHLQRRDASPEDAVAPTRINEFPDHWRFRKQKLSVTHRVDAVVAHDFDGDGMIDLIYAGQPPELVFMRQHPKGVFEVSRRHRVRGLAANRNGLAVANVIGDAAPELLALVRGSIHVWPMTGDLIGEPTELSAGEDLVAFMIEDYNGDGRQDIVGIVPEDSAPVRLWLAGGATGDAVLAAQLRFDLPPLREFEPVRLPNRAKALLATIERPSKRLVVYELVEEQVESSGDRDASLRAYSFTDSRNRNRDTAVVDVNGDGLLDLVATDTEANALVVYEQESGKGLQNVDSYPSLSDMNGIATGNVDDDPFAEIFVLSEKEGVVGRCDAGANGVPFPVPLGITEGFTPVALNLVMLDGASYVAVVVRDGRSYQLDLIDMNGDRRSVELGSLSRSPDTVLALDADQNGRTDLLVFTPDKPMTMLYADDDGYTLMESKDMGQFGLVKAASANNTGVFDVDGDGQLELLIADKNFTRAVRYDPHPENMANPGWQVVTQINARDSSSKLVSLAVLHDRIYVADSENKRLLVLGKDTDADAWSEIESVNIRGFSFERIYAGAFTGSSTSNILAIGNDGFAIVQLEGQRLALREVESWRSADERQYHHELKAGDVNGDGFQDLVSLDAGQQMCEIFTFTQSEHLLYATGFQVFESQLFSGGEPREFQPSQVQITDVTADGANDIILLSHDRILVYPQMTRDDVVNAD